jgi:hypothetical protein
MENRRVLKGRTVTSIRIIGCLAGGLISPVLAGLDALTKPGVFPSFPGLLFALSAVPANLLFGLFDIELAIYHGASFSVGGLCVISVVNALLGGLLASIVLLFRRSPGR